MPERLNISRKVRYLRNYLGCRSTIVREMDCGSVTSLKRWERQKCTPIKAHRKSLNELHAAAKRTERRLSRKVEQQIMQRMMRKKMEKNK